MANLRSLRNGGNYVFRMTKELYSSIWNDLVYVDEHGLTELRMPIEDYVTRNFGLLGTCIKVETY